MSFSSLESDAHKVIRDFKRNKIHRDAHILPPIDQKNIQQTVQIAAACIRPALEKIADGQTDFPPHSYPDSDDPAFAEKFNQLAAKALKIFNKYCPEKAKVWITSLQDNISKAMNKITNGDPQKKKIFAVMIFSLVIAMASAFISSRDNDLTYTETLQQMLLSIFPTLSFGALFSLMQTLGAHQLIVGLKAATQALAIETFESTLSLIASGLIGFFVTILWDIFVTIYDNSGKGHSMMDWIGLLGQSLLTSFQHNSLQALSCTAIAYICPAWATILICAFTSISIAQLKETARQRNESIYFTASKAALEIIAFVPQTLWYTFVGYPVFRGEYPEVFLCEVTYELLDDPVFFRGYVVSRSVAQRRLNDSGRDFYNMPATPDDVLPIPKLKTIVDNVRLHRPL
jgi:hypothetical protein